MNTVWRNEGEKREKGNIRKLTVTLYPLPNPSKVKKKNSLDTVPLKGKLTVTRELRNLTRDSILDPRKISRMFYTNVCMHLSTKT